MVGRTNVKAVSVPVAAVDATHPDRLRPTVDVEDRTLDFADDAKQGNCLTVIVVGAELWSFVRCRRLLEYTQSLENRGVKVDVIPIVGTRRMRLSGQIGWPFVDTMVEETVPAHYSADIQSWCKTQRWQRGQHVTWRRADGVDVEIVLTTPRPHPGSVLPPDVVGAVVERRNIDAARTKGTKGTKGASRPLVFVSNHAPNRRAGATGVTGRCAPRMCGESGWNALSGLGYGCDNPRYPVHPLHAVSCAAHVSEIACYPPGDPVPFRVLYTAFPPDDAEVDAIVNDLSPVQGQKVYLLGPPTSTPRVATDVMQRSAAAVACPFLPDEIKSKIRPVTCPHGTDSVKDVLEISREWEVCACAWGRVCVYVYVLTVGVRKEFEMTEGMGY
jgi:hypothetical protein